MSNSRGIFISFEGGEGVGKSTQILLLAWRLEAAGLEVLRLREPGGTKIGEAIRAVLLDPRNTELNATAELLLYEAARAQLISEVVAPALERGVVVLCDRFTDSTLAYQGVARGLGLDIVEAANRLGSRGLSPDRTVLLTHDTELALDRATVTGADRLEAEGIDFHLRVLAGFEQLAKSDPERVRTVQSQPQKSDTAAAVFAQLQDLFPQIDASHFSITAEVLERVKKEHDR